MTINPCSDQQAYRQACARPTAQGGYSGIVHKLLKPSGLSIAKFEPLYSSPYGSCPLRFSAELVVHLLRSDVELC